MSCCSMRAKKVRYLVYDAQGRLVQSVSSEQRARNLAMGVHGHYKREWTPS